MQSVRKLAFTTCTVSALLLGGASLAGAAPVAGIGQAAPSVLSTEDSRPVASFIQKAWWHHHHWWHHHWCHHHWC